MQLWTWQVRMFVCVLWVWVCVVTSWQQHLQHHQIVQSHVTYPLCIAPFNAQGVSHILMVPGGFTLPCCHKARGRQCWHIQLAPQRHSE